MTKISAFTHLLNNNSISKISINIKLLNFAGTGEVINDLP